MMEVRGMPHLRDAGRMLDALTRQAEDYGWAVLGLAHVAAAARVDDALAGMEAALGAILSWSGAGAEDAAALLALGSAANTFAQQPYLGPEYLVRRHSRDSLELVRLAGVQPPPGRDVILECARKALDGVNLARGHPVEIRYEIMLDPKVVSSVQDADDLLRATPPPPPAAGEHASSWSTRGAVVVRAVPFKDAAAVRAAVKKLPPFWHVTGTPLLAAAAELDDMLVCVKQAMEMSLSPQVVSYEGAMLKATHFNQCNELADHLTRAAKGSKISSLQRQPALAVAEDVRDMVRLSRVWPLDAAELRRRAAEVAKVIFFLRQEPACLE